MNLYALSVNHRVNPLGINSAEQPYFGWKLKSEKPNTMQAAYRLQIYADDTVCFDSGRVETTCNAFVCGPDLLRPQTFYRWAVTVWDNHGENTTAESSFETSLSSKEWKADWMRTPRAYVQRKKGFGTQPPATLFRRAFTLSAAPRRARLYATCLGVYRLTVNGKRPDMREFAPEHTSYKGLLCFQTYDLTALLHIGENVLGMEVGDGWYCCPQTQPPIDGLQPDHTVLFQLEIENADGTHTRICSDEGVLTHESAVRASDIFD
uniref:alpha-L-rhamnosidase N-terminal domain-containing protein n=1 Tax=Gemmiger formicilis TaxID=745368 RepID=UPI0040287529